MAQASGTIPEAKRVLVATDRSASADTAVRWAAGLAGRYGAELLVLRVLVPPMNDGTEAEVTPEERALAEEDLQLFAAEVAGERGRAKVVVDGDPAHAILQAIEDVGIDVVVVGNLGMAGRRQFLLGNIPNRISHSARCTVIIVNTAQLTGLPGAAPLPPHRDEGADVEGRLLGRAMRIARVMAKAGLRELRDKPPPGDADAGIRMRARRVRDALDELGPTFAKLGQILSTRPDLLPKSFIDELATLQDRVTPLTEAEVVAAMERELGVPWEDVFASIDPKPLAAGTIAQVHRATLETGERVVVKVQRPTAERDITQDLGLLEMFADKIAERPVFRQVVDLPAMIRHLSDSLRRELDFRREASNLKRMHEVLGGYSRLAVPKVYEEYSTSRLLVMEEIGGVRLSEAPPGPARKEAARQLLESYYKQVMVDGFFHADPHPGNMRWWNDKIYLLDLGMVGEVEPYVRELMLLLLLAFSQKDAAFLSDIVLMLAGGDGYGDEVDMDAFRADLADLVERYSSLALKDIQLGPMLQEVTTISVRHNVRIPAALALTGKAFSQMQLAAAELDPTLDPFEVARSFGMRHALQQVTKALDPQKTFYEVQKLRARLTRVFEGLESLVGARPGGRFQVQFRGAEGLEQAIGRAGRRFALGMVVGGTAVGTAVMASAEAVPTPITTAMGIVAVGLGIVLITDLLRGR